MAAKPTYFEVSELQLSKLRLPRSVARLKELKTRKVKKVTIDRKMDYRCSRLESRRQEKNHATTLKYKTCKFINISVLNNSSIW